MRHRSCPSCLTAWWPPCLALAAGGLGGVAELGDKLAGCVRAAIALVVRPQRLRKQGTSDRGWTKPHVRVPRPEVASAASI